MHYCDDQSHPEKKCCSKIGSAALLDFVLKSVASDQKKLTTDPERTLNL